MLKDSSPLALPIEEIKQCILFIRDEKIMLDARLAILYGVQTKILVQAIKRNIERFPADFMFQLTQEEFQDFLRSQNVTSKRGGRRYPPTLCIYRTRCCYAFQRAT